MSKGKGEASELWQSTCFHWKKIAYWRASTMLYPTNVNALLMVVITSVATDTRAVGQAAAIAIGGTIGLEALFAGPISGASMNPARSLAPAVVSWTWESQWLYVLGPALGAVLGALAYQFIRGETTA